MAVSACGGYGTEEIAALLAKQPGCQLKDTTPRGIACLHCNHPKAKNQAGELISILTNACVKRPATNYLIDGSFGFDAAMMDQHIAALSTDGREPHIVFYVSNGPWQRRRRSDLKAFGTQMRPEEFRKKIQKSNKLRGRYQDIVRRLVPTLEHLIAAGGKAYLVPMLEDNLNDKAFNAMVSLTRASLPASLQGRVKIGRSACSSCYPGNTHGRGPNIFEERHNTRGEFSTRDGVVSNDGVHYGKPGELSSALKRSARQNDVFILWTDKYQGVVVGETFKNPSKRDYKRPSSGERQAIIRLLNE